MVDPNRDRGFQPKKVRGSVYQKSINSRISDDHFDKLVRIAKLPEVTALPGKNTIAKAVRVCIKTYVEPIDTKKVFKRIE